MTLRLTRNLTFFLFLSLAACGETLGPIDVNPNFPSLGGVDIAPSASVDPTSSGQVIDVAPNIADPDPPGSVELVGVVGSIADQETDAVLCVIIDGDGGNVDLEVCDSDKANRQTTTADQVCPDDEDSTYCSSTSSGENPDFCEVTGARDYAFAIINRSTTEAQVAYQIINVTLLSEQSCSDLNITEDSITADTL